MIEILQTLDYLAGIFYKWHFGVQFFVLFLLFAFTVAPDLAFEIYINQPILLLLEFLLTTARSMKDSAVSTYQHFCTTSDQFLHATAHDGHPLLVFLITALLFSILWCMNRKKLLSQITTLEDQAIQTNLVHNKARNTSEAAVQAERESRIQIEKELATVLADLNGAGCPRGCGFNICLDTKMVMHSCCQHKQRLEKEVQSLKSLDYGNKAKIKCQQAKIRELQQNKPLPKQNDSESKHYASLYQMEKLQRECYENDISRLTDDKRALQQTKDMALTLLQQKDDEVKQLEKKLRAAKRKAIETTAQPVVSIPTSSNEAVVKRLEEHIEDLKVTVESAENAKAAAAEEWVNINLELEKEKETLEEKVKTLQEANDRLESENAQLEAKSEKALLKCGELQQAKEESEALGSKLLVRSSQHEGLQDEVTMLSTQKGELEKQVKELLRKIESEESTMQALRGQLAERDSTIDTLNCEKNEEKVRLQAELSNLNITCAELERQLTEAQAILASVPQNQMSLEDASRRIEVLETELNQLNIASNNTIAALQLALQGNEASSRNLENELEAASQKLQNFETESSAAVAEEAIEEDAVDEKPRKRMREVAAEEEDNRKATEMMTDLEDERYYFKEKFEQAQVDIFKMVTEERQWKDMVAKNDALSKENQAAQQGMGALQHELAFLKNHMNKLIKTLHERDAEIKQLKAGPPTEEQKRAERKKEEDHLAAVRQNVLDSLKKP